ncbi:hypothetical protein M378DRAFT_357290 [Amanita muscaria Koide BX008]|uniref:Uncharacterized protein n=1 Tax=Amanita muscaria (strain Koide BX008) TaxID=946122 RepID=A0A0C2WNS0_AMAMK|nr:hypothetical protein M378DRAFT_357290 [Amanita muscaria Koide BX008]
MILLFFSRPGYQATSVCCVISSVFRRSHSTANPRLEGLETQPGLKDNQFNTALVCFAAHRNSFDRICAPIRLCGLLYVAVGLGLQPCNCLLRLDSLFAYWNVRQSIIHKGKTALTTQPVLRWVWSRSRKGQQNVTNLSRRRFS